MNKVREGESRRNISVIYNIVVNWVNGALGLVINQTILVIVLLLLNCRQCRLHLLLYVYCTCIVRVRYMSFSRNTSQIYE